MLLSVAVLTVMPAAGEITPFNSAAAVVVPTATPVTTPVFAPTLAMAVSSDDQVTCAVMSAVVPFE